MLVSSYSTLPISSSSVVGLADGEGIPVAVFPMVDVVVVGATSARFTANI